VKAAQAQLRTVEEQIRALRTDLTYYHVTAPTAGIVGDIPVHEGDRVTKSTQLTTIDAQAGLEVYLNIPVQQAPQLKTGLPVRLVDDTGAPLAAESINFISPTVDTTTQTVLTIVPLGVRAGFRTSQFVRAQVIWSTDPGIMIPVTAVTRINGQFFAFVAEPGQGGALVAHQRAVTLGRVIGNDYVVLSGLKPGDKLIVSGIQKIGDGAPVRGAGGAAGAAGGGR
jgi:RND family efflux transporter MFP subunit